MRSRHACLKHDAMFWRSFAQICRLARGFIYLNALSNGPFHRYPDANWGFFRMPGPALAEWGRHK